MADVKDLYYFQRHQQRVDDAMSAANQNIMDQVCWAEWFENIQGCSMAEQLLEQPVGQSDTWEKREKIPTPVGVRVALQVLIKEVLVAGCRAFRDSKAFWRQAGLDEALLREVEELSVPAFDEFTAMVTHLMLMNDLKFDIDVLNASAGLLIRQKAENHLLHEFVTMGASTPMLRDLFGLRSHDIVAIREKLGVVQPGGRPRRASSEEATYIMENWHSQLASVDVRLRLLWVHQETGLPLTSVFDVVRIHDRTVL
ncbi:MAG: hypothetical protein RL336_1047 [Pseudomonadota bacterium]|jgi:hypothetical protein